MLLKYIIVAIGTLFIVVACSSNIPSSHRKTQKQISDQNYKNCKNTIKKNVFWLKDIHEFFTYDRFRKCQNDYYLLELNSIHLVTNKALIKATYLLRNRIYQTDFISKASIKVRFSLPNGKYSSFSGLPLRQSGSGGKDISAKGSGETVKDEKDIWRYTKQLISKLKLLLAGRQLTGKQRVFSLGGKVTVKRIQSIMTEYYTKLKNNSGVMKKLPQTGKLSCSDDSSTYIKCNITLLGIVIKDGGVILELKFRTSGADDIYDTRLWLDADGFYEYKRLKSNEALLSELDKRKNFIESNEKISKAVQAHINELYDFLIEELIRESQ